MARRFTLRGIFRSRSSRRNMRRPPPPPASPPDSDMQPAEPSGGPLPLDGGAAATID